MRLRPRAGGCGFSLVAAAALSARLPTGGIDPQRHLRSSAVRRVVVLVLSGLLLGVLLTGVAGALPGSQDLNALTWLATVSTVAALVVAVRIYRVQQAQSDVAHQELLDALKAQDEILQDLADTTPPSVSPALGKEDDALTAAQREAVEAQYGDRSIDAAWKLGGGRGNRPRLVRLEDGTLVTVFSRGRGGGVGVHQVKPRREGSRPSRDRRLRGPKST
jgi:hypothetical protein